MWWEAHCSRPRQEAKNNIKSTRGIYFTMLCLGCKWHIVLLTHDSAVTLMLLWPLGNNLWANAYLKLESCGRTSFRLSKTLAPIVVHVFAHFTQLEEGKKRMTTLYSALNEPSVCEFWGRSFCNVQFSSSEIQSILRWAYLVNCHQDYKSHLRNASTWFVRHSAHLHSHEDLENT